MPSYLNDKESTTASEIAVESGRLVIVPVTRKLHRPMDEFCLYVAFCGERMTVSILTMRHPHKKKKRRVSEIVIARTMVDGQPSVAHVWGTFPMLFVGDAAFFYNQESDREERDRAFEAAHKESKLGGSYRRANGQVGVCVRLGDKDLRLMPEITMVGGIAERIVIRNPEGPSLQE